MSDHGLPVPIVCDGHLRDEFMQSVGMTRQELLDLLEEKGIGQKDLFLMTVDAKGNAAIVKKEESR